MTTVASVMTHGVLTVPREASLVEAARALSTQGVSGAPVCDDRGHLVGVVSHAELVDAVLTGPARTTRGVGDVMSLDVVTASPDEEVGALARRMVFEGAHRAIVLDALGAVTGIVTPLDLLHAILDGEDALPKRGAHFPSWPPAEPPH